MDTYRLVLSYIGVHPAIAVDGLVLPILLGQFGYLGLVSLFKTVGVALFPLEANGDPVHQRSLIGH